MADPPDIPPHPWDGFLVGEENALAHAGVIALARGDAAGVSPLILHGPSGSGKTRLLAGLVAERISRRPGAAVAHLAAETFAVLCAEAAGTRGGFGDLRERFRALDLFALDDLHALENAPLALGELAHTLDALEEAGASVAASARVGPGRWSNWPERLVNRLIGGLSVRVDLPGPESRRRYVLERSRSRGLRLSADAVEALSSQAEDYRALDGLIARVAHSEARSRSRPLDPALPLDVLTDDASDRPTSLQSGRDDRPSRGRAVRRPSPRPPLLLPPPVPWAIPRHFAILLVRRGTDLSFASLGRYFGRRDAATVRHACRMAEARLLPRPRSPPRSRRSKGDGGHEGRVGFKSPPRRHRHRHLLAVAEDHHGNGLAKLDLLGGGIGVGDGGGPAAVEGGEDVAGLQSGEPRRGSRQEPS